MDYLHDTNVWYIFSFVIFVGVIMKFGMPALNALLDSRIQQIKDDIKEAESLRVEAQEMLAQYQRKHRDAVEESEKIINSARENAALLREKALSELDLTMARREEQLNDRLERMKQNAINDIQAYAAKISIETSKGIIEESLNKTTHNALLKQSIDELEANIH